MDHALMHIMRFMQLGYRCIAISEGFTDAERFEVLQVDGLFVRD